MDIPRQWERWLLFHNVPHQSRMQLLMIDVSQCSSLLVRVLFKKPAVKLSQRQMKKSFQEHDFH